MAMRNARRLLAGLLGSLLLLSGCSTLPQTTTPSESASDGADAEAQRPVTPATAALPYRAADTLDPYTAQSRVNRQLLPLLYEGLVAVDASWDAVPALASTWTQPDALHLVFTLADDAAFSDGTPVRAADVASSFLKARNHESYTALLANVASVVATDERTVTVTLTAADPHAVSALSFPVVREQKDACLGTGAYRLDGDALVLNPYAGVTAAVERWALYDISREDEMAYALESGAIAAYFTELNDGEAPRTVSTVRQVAVTMNDLVFLGVNSARTTFQDASVRAAVSAALSRETLCTNAFGGYAVPATTPFHPDWSGAKTLSGFSKTENIALTVAKWQELGYNTLDIELLYCSDSPLHEAAAQELVRQFGLAGVHVQTAALPQEEYRARVAAGQFDLYLGEVRLSADLSLRPLLTRYGAASSGVSEGGFAIYASYLGGELSAEEFCEAFTAEVPFIPLCFRQGAGVFDAALRGMEPTAVDVYGGITEWTLS